MKQLDFYEAIAWIFRLRDKTYVPSLLTTHKGGECFYLHVVIPGPGKAAPASINIEFIPRAVFKGQHALIKKKVPDKHMLWYEAIHPCPKWIAIESCGTLIYKSGGNGNLGGSYDTSQRGLMLGLQLGNPNQGADFVQMVNEAYRRVNGDRSKVEVYWSLDT